jgi:hypothetical protein
MNPSLKDFFEEEKKRVFTPDPYFSTRVMARLRESRTRENGIWDVIPGSTKPVFGLAIVLMLAFLAVQVFVPQVPERGFVTAALEADQGTDSAFLYSGADLPSDTELLNQLIGADEKQ